jgi:hypothetical protein
MAIAPVLKTGARKGLGVRIPHPPSATGIEKSHPSFLCSGGFLRNARDRYCPCALGAGASCASLDFIELNPASFVARLLNVVAGT